MMRDPLDQPARINKDENGSMLPSQLGEPIIDVAPNGVCRYRPKLILGHFDRQIHPPSMADVDDVQIVRTYTLVRLCREESGIRALSHQKPRHRLDGPLSSGQTDADQPLRRARFKPL